MPFGPETTEVKEASSAKLEMMMSALAAAAAGVSAIAAPAARSGSALAGVLFQTTSGYPARWILVAIASPIRPRPMKAMAFPPGLAEISILPSDSQLPCRLSGLSPQGFSRFSSTVLPAAPGGLDSPRASQTHGASARHALM